MKKRISWFVGPVAIGVTALALPATSAAAAPVAQKTQAQQQDLGPTTSTQTITASVVLKIHNSDQLESYIKDTTTPGSAHYRKFLSVNQFRAQYAPSNGQVNQVVKYLQQCGLTVNEVYADNLLIKVTGTVDQFNTAFSTSIHDYSQNGKVVHKPKHAPKVPAALSDSVLAIAGLSTEAAFHPQSQRSNALDVQQPPVVLPKDSTATGIPGEFTVGDVANLYDVNPLYQQGVTGKGQTIGIATLADFDPNDAYAYWDAIGLKYTPNRITQVHVDGGGQFSAEDGSGETTLDVQQSGGLAPDAKMVVYDAPNTDAGFMDVFYKAVSDNLVDTLSVSWGSPEFFYMDNGLTGGDYTNELTGFHQVFMEAAAQGISVFAAAGDAGAYDVNRTFGYPPFSKLVSADAPSSDPYITAAGGTTVPATLTMKHGTVTVPTERAWGWDYFNDYLTQWYGQNAVYDLGYFPVGGGGAVSSIWATPWYQQGVQGLNTTAPGQSFDLLQPITDDNGNVLMQAQHLGDLRSGFAGRNSADISMNADPETGYLVYSSADGGWIQEGGTSFVAPQLNGMTALLNQSIGGRVGLLNPTLYRLAQTQGYGLNKPFNDITAGDNWYYNAGTGYDTATGIGTPNWANLAAAVQAQGK